MSISRKIKQRKFRLSFFSKLGRSNHYVCIVRKTSSHFYADLFDKKTNTTLFSVSSLSLKIKGYNASAILPVAEEFAKKCNEKKISNVTFCANGYLYKGKVKQFAEKLRELKIII